MFVLFCRGLYCKTVHFNWESASSEVGNLKFSFNIVINKTESVISYSETRVRLPMAGNLINVSNENEYSQNELFFRF